MNAEPDAAATAAPELLLASGRYVLERRLTVGGMGEIWQGRDTVLERQVAVKLPRREFAADADFLAQFSTEARHAASLQHPNVATVFDFGAGDKGPPYIVMELIDGASLSDRLAGGRHLEVSEVRTLLRQVASALAAAHESGVWHRDVKPGNLLFRSDGSVAVTDFGIARAAGAAAVTRANELRGTAQYVSPEQVRGTPSGPASDLYALGVVGYECLVGRRPFDGTPTEVLAAKRDARPPALPSDVPSDLAELVMRLLDPEPSVRPTAAQVVAALSGTAPLPAPADAADGHTRVLPLPPAPETTRHDAIPARSGARWERRPGALLALAAGLVLLFLLGTALSHLSGGGGSRAAGGATPTPGTATRSAAVVDAQLFHPGGSGSDHATDVRLSFDGNPGTSWQTQHYASATFGNLRPGVGIVYDLGRPVQVRQVRLALTSAGAAVQVHAAADPSALLSSATLASSGDAPAAFDARLSRPSTARYWLVWFSRLPAGGSHQAGIAEARFFT